MTITEPVQTIDHETIDLPVQYPVSDLAIMEIRRTYEGATAGTKEGYELCRQGIAATRKLRGDVEKRRVDLKADALEWGHKVDREAKRLTGLLMEIEEPLKTSKQAVDDEKARKIREAEEAERAKVEAEAKAKRDAEEAALRAEREALAAERAEMEQKQAAERHRIRAEQYAIEQERRKIEAAHEAERARLAAEQRAIDAERQRLERIEFERLAKEKAEKEARERVERERIEAERAKREAELVAEAERRRVAEQTPDVEKIREYGKALRALVVPVVKTAVARKFLAASVDEVLLIADSCERQTVLK